MKGCMDAAIAELGVFRSSVCLRIHDRLLEWKRLRQRLAWEEGLAGGSVVNN